jgi:hypothetical protein
MGHGDLTKHGLHSTFRDWAAEATKYPHVAEQALAHLSPDEVEPGYRCGDLTEKRRQSMRDRAAGERCRSCPVVEEVIGLRRDGGYRPLNIPRRYQNSPK